MDGTIGLYFHSLDRHSLEIIYDKHHQRTTFCTQPYDARSSTVCSLYLGLGRSSTFCNVQLILYIGCMLCLEPIVIWYTARLLKPSGHRKYKCVLHLRVMQKHVMSTDVGCFMQTVHVTSQDVKSAISLQNRPSISKLQSMFKVPVCC